MARYRALNTIEYPTDPAIIARLRAGENLPYNQRGAIRRLKPGDIADDLPAASIAGLLARGDIEVAPEPAPDPEPEPEAEEG